MENVPLGLMWYAVFLFSTVCHEAAHAWTALKLGDSTAYEGGQVSLNPIPHIKRSPIGMVLAPLFTFATMGWMMGWASTPYQFQWALNYPKKSALMSLAGPSANLALTLLSALAIHAGIGAGVFRPPSFINFSTVVEAAQPGFFTAAATFVSILFTLNLLLFSFNLLPLPPMDGSGIVALVMSDSLAQKYILFIHRSGFSLIALLVAWKVFPFLFEPIYTTAIGILYPGAFYH